MGATVTIPKRITHGEELVVLSRSEYERIVRYSEEIVHALKIIAEGEQAYRDGKTIKADSLKGALKIYAKRAHH